MYKSIRVLAAAAVTATCLGGAHAGVVAHYSFDSDFTDSSANNNHLTAASGTPSITTTAGDFKFGGGALNLDNPYPSGSTRDHLEMTSNIVLSDSATNGWSIAFWAKDRLGYQNFGGTVLGNSASPNSRLWLDMNSPGVRVTNAVASSMNIGPGGEDRAWHHWVLVYEDADNDSAVDDVTLYFDGLFYATVNNFGGSFDFNAVGSSNGNARYAFGGQLDEIFILDEAIGSAQVDSLFNGNQAYTGEVPEPGSLALVGLGGLMLIARRRRS